MANNETYRSLDDLQVFQAVADTGGFRAAARALGQSPSGVSETITQLETRLGVALFNRTTRSVMLTEAGRLLSARIGPLLADTRAALDEAASSQAQVRGRLRLNVPAAVMIDILPPILDRFMSRHPEVHVDLIVEDRLVDITRAECDAGIRYGEHLEQDMIAVPIGPERQQAAVAAAPSYWARRGVPAHPSQLAGHDCIRTRLSGAALFPWEFEQGAETLILDPPTRLSVNSGGALAAIGLSIAGHGVIYIFRNWLDPHFESGALVPALADWWPSYDGPRLYFSSRRVAPPLRALVDMLAQERRAGAA
ncbi:LysR family transcriptional regulator [Nostoc sp. 3335mG]|nr:LysR family transcriptional regulator [Nostoc sp. 3335mG]